MRVTRNPRKTADQNFFHPYGVKETGMKNCTFQAAESALFSAAMPKLPSGRNIVVGFHHIDSLIRQALDNEDAALLFFIDRYAEMFRFVEIADFELREDIPACELDCMMHEGGVHYGIAHRTGEFVKDVVLNRANWPADDLAAFRKFMLSPRVREALRQRRRGIVCVRDHLTSRAKLKPFWQLPRPAIETPWLDGREILLPVPAAP